MYKNNQEFHHSPFKISVNHVASISENQFKSMNSGMNDIHTKKN